MGKFRLVNPVIIGNFQNSYESSTAMDAAKNFWEELTGKNYITNNVPQFLFTLENESGKSLHHYMVKEKIAAEGSKFADYSIEEVSVKLTKAQQKEFLDEVAKVKSRMGNEKGQSGGKSRKQGRKRYDDDDSSSSSDDDDDILDYIRMRRFDQPISYWWYAPTVYNVKTLFTPTFVSPLYPYVQMWFPPTFVPTR